MTSNEKQPTAFEQAMLEHFSGIHDELKDIKTLLRDISKNSNGSRTMTASQFSRLAHTFPKEPIMDTASIPAAPATHVCKCKHTVTSENSRARVTDRYDAFEDLFFRDIERLVNDIKIIERDHNREEHSTPVPARHTKAYSELEARKIQESAQKILVRTQCFLQNSKKLADQVAALSRHTEKLTCVDCNGCNRRN